MTPFVSTLIYVMAIATVIIDVALVIKLLALFHKPSRMQIMRGGAKYGLLAIFILSTLAVAGTLFIQFAGGLNPCDLCWWQRIFMYPIPLLSLIALIKGQSLSDVADYVLALSFIGALFSLYQHLLQVLPAGSLIPCDASNDCAIRAVFYFNFVTIPWMALSVFVAIFLITLVARFDRNARV
jgi:disulfide bond formation protein DsbB